MPSPHQTTVGKTAHQLGESFARRTLPAIVALLFLTLLASVAILVQLARNQDQRALEQSHFFADKAVQARQQQMLRLLIDNAFWGDAYEHLSNRVDIAWAYESQNLGAPLFTTFGYEGVLVVNPAGRTTYAVIDGQLSQRDARQWLQGDLDGLIDRAREALEDDSGALGLLEVDGQPALVAAAELSPAGDPRVSATPGPASVLLFVYLLSAEKLAALGQDYALPNLRVADASSASNAPALTLGHIEGAPVMLTWDPEQPGRHMLRWVLPLIGLVALVLAALTWQVLRHALVAIRLLDAGYARLTQHRTELAASEARFRDVAEAASDWFWETDATLRLTYLSERFEEVTGHPPSRWLGQRLDQLLETEGPPLTLALGDGRNTLKCCYTAANGHPRICRLTGRRIHSAALEPSGYRGSASDITEEASAQARIQYLSQHDPLTGLPNRHQLHEFLEGKLRQAPSLERPVVMLSIDLNRFKPINDAFGHAAGDRILHEVSERLRSCIRDEDLVARHGGDEFIMVLGGCHTEQAIEQVCTRLIERIEQPYQINTHEVYLGASIGISSAPTDATEVEELLRYADIALYQAKASGRSGWRFYSHEMNQRIIERRQLEQDLRLALTVDDQLLLHFQPRYRVRDNRMIGAEALVRWNHPQRGMIPPDQFIGIAEETGLIAQLGEWVLHSACQEASRWSESLLVSVNLSPLQFRRNDLADLIQAALTQSGLPAERLELEITESVMIDDAQGALVTLLRLKALGLRLSMDDFGTGYSSLSYLSNYPFDALKIDRSFIANLAQSPDRRAIVQAIIGLGRALSMCVTAEGVETAEQLELLRQDGCDEAQGYLLARPLPVAALHDLMQVALAG